MCQRFLFVAAFALWLSAATAFAQCGCSSAPVYAPVATNYVASYTPAPYIASYAPAPVAYAPTSYVSYYTAPAVYAPTSYVTNYTAPVAYTATPYVSYYAPVTPYVSYYTPYTTAYAPYAYTAAYAPTAVPYAVAGYSIYGAPRLYVPGEPVRNVVRAITP